MLYLLAVFNILLPAVLCSVIANVDGRNVKRWFWYGFFFGIFAIIYLVFFTKKNDEDKIEKKILILMVVVLFLFLFGVFDSYYGVLEGLL